MCAGGICAPLCFTFFVYITQLNLNTIGHSFFYAFAKCIKLGISYCQSNTFKHGPRHCKSHNYHLADAIIKRHSVGDRHTDWDQYGIYISSR